MNILQVLPSLESGGVERCVVDLCNYLIKQNCNVFVISNGGWMTTLFDKKCKHKKMNIGSKNPFQIIKNARRIKIFCEKNKIDIVHVHSRAPAWACYMAWKRSSFKLVTTFHGVYSTKGLFKKFYNAVMTKSDAIIAVSDFVKNHIIKEYGILSKSITAINRGIDLNLYSRENVTAQRIVSIAKKLQIEDDKFVILMPARVTPIKGHIYLMEALSLVQRKDYICIFVGGWKGREKFKLSLDKKAKKLKIEDRIRFVGEMRDMSALYMISDLVIAPSIKPEAFGRVVIEAGAMGKIVMATNLGAPRDNIVNGVTGYLVSPKDKVALSRKILEVMDKEIHKDENMSKRIIEHIRTNFDVNESCGREYEIYKKIMKED